MARVRVTVGIPRGQRDRISTILESQGFHLILVDRVPHGRSDGSKQP